jgi:hypothetical protein
MHLRPGATARGNRNIFTVTSLASIVLKELALLQLIQQLSIL